MQELRLLSDDAALREALLGLAEGVADVHLESILELALSLKNQEARVKVFGALAMRLPASRIRQELPHLVRRLPEALQVELLSRLAMHPVSHSELLQDLVDVALELKVAHSRAAALAGLGEAGYPAGGPKPSGRGPRLAAFNSPAIESFPLGCVVRHLSPCPHISQDWWP